MYGRMNASASSGVPGAAASEKPFACPVPGCKKRYKNVNGIKYHSKNGHKKDGKVKKGYKCHCGKSYRTAQGLKSHSITQHLTPSQPALPPPAAPLGPHVPKMPGLVVTASPARQLNLIDATDGNKLVRIYDSVKDMAAYTIPKHNLTSLNIVSGQQLRHSGLLTPNSTPGSSPVEKKFDRSPRVTVQSQLAPVAPPYDMPN